MIDPEQSQKYVVEVLRLCGFYLNVLTVGKATEKIMIAQSFFDHHLEQHCLNVAPFRKLELNIVASKPKELNTSELLPNITL